MSDRGGCTQGCRNSVGSYSCYCGEGYILNSDLKTCDNINECTSNLTNYCYSNDFCTDTDGFYICGCPDDFVLKVTTFKTSYFCSRDKLFFHYENANS